MLVQLFLDSLKLRAGKGAVFKMTNEMRQKLPLHNELECMQPARQAWKMCFFNVSGIISYNKVYFVCQGLGLVLRVKHNLDELKVFIHKLCI